MQVSRLKRALAAVALALGAVAASPAQARVDDLVTRALALHQGGKPEEAYRLLLPSADARAGDPDFDYALGIAAVDADHPAEAILALQRVLAVQPENAQARAEIARAYAASGDIDTARAQFDTVLNDPSLPDPVRQRFDRLVRDYGRQIAGGGSDVSGFADVSAGYDSNINQATNLAQITIPLFSFFGPGTLSGSARRMGDEFVETLGGVSGVKALGRQDRVFGSVLGNYRDNLSSRFFDQAGATGTLGVAHTTASRDTISLSGQVQQFWLGRQGYREAFGGIAQYTHLLDRGHALTFAGQFFHLNYDNQPLLDANRFAGAVSYVGRVFIATVSGGHEETVRQAGDAQSNSFGDASLGIEVPVGSRIALVGGAAFDLRRYDREDALFLVRRRDERIDLNAGVKVLMMPHLYIRPAATYSRNFSNIALYAFERWTASVGVRFEF